jgi:hypothetical protein
LRQVGKKNVLYQTRGLIEHMAIGNIKCGTILYAGGAESGPPDILARCSSVICHTEDEQDGGNDYGSRRTF